MKKLLNILLITTMASSLFGVTQVMPKKITKSFWNPTTTSGKAYILDEKYGKPIDQIKRGQKYVKNHNEAIVFWVGGPKFSQSWNKDLENYAYKFGKAKHSKDLAKNKVEGNYDIPYDVYGGVQLHWEGIKSNKYFAKEFKASNKSGFENKDSQRAVTLNDVKYIKENKSKNNYLIVEQMFNDQVKLMEELAVDLLNVGYKKVHFIGHSYGSFLVNYFIKLKGDNAFKYVSTIHSVGGRIKSSENVRKTIDGTFFPYFHYNEKTKKYDKILKAPIQNNAITIGIAMEVFKMLIKTSDYSKTLSSLSSENKKRFKLLSTEFDFRVGSLSKNVISEQQDIKIVEVPWQTILRYQQNYLIQNKNHEFITVPKTSLLKKGMNHHDVLLRWYLDNTLSKWTGSNWLTKEGIVFSKHSYWCSIQEFSDEEKMKGLCEK